MTLDQLKKLATIARAVERKKVIAEIIAMMENKKDRAEHFGKSGKVCCLYWITVLQSEIDKIKT